MSTQYFNIAVDGPAGSGKSTVSQEFAKRHSDFLYINTGAMFRTYALYLIDHHVSIDDLDSIQQALNSVSVELTKDSVYMVMNNQEPIDVTNTIKNPEVAKMASQIASLPMVRSKLLVDQRAIANNHNVIMDGRDIGTVVLPQAQLKIYLEASAKERALRRLKELELLDPSAHFELHRIEQEINERDYKDMHREIAPLKKADDAIVIDTDGMTIQTCCDAIDKIYNDYLANHK